MCTPAPTVMHLENPSSIAELENTGSPTRMTYLCAALRGRMHAGILGERVVSGGEDNGKQNGKSGRTS